MTGIISKLGQFMNGTMLKKTPIIISIVISISSGALDIYLENYYFHIGSTMPMSELGRIYQLNIHGSIAYLTRKEHLTLIYLAWLSGLSFLAAYLLYVTLKPFKK